MISNITEFRQLFFPVRRKTGKNITRNLVRCQVRFPQPFNGSRAYDQGHRMATRVERVHRRHYLLEEMGSLDGPGCTAVATRVVSVHRLGAGRTVAGRDNPLKIGRSLIRCVTGPRPLGRQAARHRPCGFDSSGGARSRRPPRIVIPPLPPPFFPRRKEPYR